MHQEKGKFHIFMIFRLHFIYTSQDKATAKIKETRHTLKHLRDYAKDRYKAVV